MAMGQMGFPPRSVCMVCGVDLWDVERFASAGSLTVCDSCVDAMKAGLDSADESGEVAVAIPMLPPAVHGDAPDADAAMAIANAFILTFDSNEERLDDFLEDATELGALLAQGRVRFGPTSRFGARVDAVRFRRAGHAEVRFRILMNGNPVGTFQGSASKRDGKWRVTRETVESLLRGYGISVGTATRTYHRQDD
jgi:hypothetical protein